MILERSQKFPDKYPAIHIFTTFFYTKLKNDGALSLKRWTKKFDFFAKEIIIIPVHLGQHWVCASINFKKKRFEYYDSLHAKNYTCLKVRVFDIERFDLLLQLLRDYVNQESLNKRSEPYDFSGWTEYLPSVSTVI
jgi:sentrin-specific protease 1